MRSIDWFDYNLIGTHKKRVHLDVDILCMNIDFNNKKIGYYLGKYTSIIRLVFIKGLDLSNKEYVNVYNMNDVEKLLSCCSIHWNEYEWKLNKKECLENFFGT